jgi:hypothetical protein
MSKRIVSAVALLGAASIISGCNVKQPSAGCQVQDADFANWQAHYTLKTGDATSSCGQLKGEALGVFKYVDPEVASSNRLGIRPERAAALTEYTMDDEDHTVVARVENASVATALSGDLDDEPNADGLCAASGFPVTTVAAAPVLSSTGETLVPAQTVSYAFENVEVYSAAFAPGTQLRGTLKYGDGTGCQAEYEVNAFWPQTGCDPESTKPAETCGAGSGINPDFDVRCEASLANTIIADFDDDDNPIYWPGACVLSKKAPSFK